MSLDPSTLQTLNPSQFTTFTIPNPIINHHLHTPLLRIAVLDSPTPTPNHTPPLTAAMIVPHHRETDWNFCTQHGHLQLLHNFPNLSRLILIGNNLDIYSEPLDYVRTVINIADMEKLECELKGLVIALHPKVCFVSGVPKPLFVSYDDDVLQRVVVEKFVGPLVGEFLVEDVELESGEFRFRRRLRFKRMPNLIQSQVRVVGSVCDMELGLQGLREMKGVEFRVEVGTLVQPYLAPMVSGVFLIGKAVDDRVRRGFSPRALCLGVGGGALLSFLNGRLGFEVVGVEADEIVLSVAKQYFGLREGKSIQLIVGDAIKLVETAYKNRNDPSVEMDGLDVKFDVVMVDLDSSDARSGISAPPTEFVRKLVFQATRSVLYDHGVLVINVIPSNELFYETLVQQLQDVFHKVYAMDVKNDGNIVLMATLSPIATNGHDCDFAKRLRDVVSGSYIESIVEL